MEVREVTQKSLGITLRKYIVQVPVIAWVEYEVWADNDKQAAFIAKTALFSETDKKVLSRVKADIETTDVHEIHVEKVLTEYE